MKREITAMARISSTIATVLTGTLALLSGEVLLPSPASAQSLPSPSCAKAGGDFACVAALDGTSVQQIIIGNWGQQVGTAGWVIIIENTGAVRKCIGWAGSSGGGCSSITITTK
jgi:hypothetical protein